jgi:predicted secreted protein
MKIRTFNELREAAKDKAAKAQTTTKDKESDFFGTSRAKGEQDFRDAHGMDIQIKANKLKDNDHFSPNMKPATHRADGEKQPVRQGNSSQPGPTKLFQVKEEEQIDENIEMNEDVFSSLKALASSNKSGNLKFKNGETGLVNSKSAGKIVDAYNKLSPENAKQMKLKMNSDVVGFMKVLHFVDKSAKAV